MFRNIFLLIILMTSHVLSGLRKSLILSSIGEIEFTNIHRKT